MTDERQEELAEFERDLEHTEYLLDWLRAHTADTEAARDQLKKWIADVKAELGKNT
jgi:hypothetical protein